MTISETPRATPAGWYRDPRGLPEERWWDGSGWTDYTRPDPIAQDDVAASPAPVPAPANPYVVPHSVGSDWLPAASAAADPASETAGRSGRRAERERRPLWMAIGVAASLVLLGGGLAGGLALRPGPTGTPAAEAPGDTPKYAIDGTFELPIRACSSGSAGYRDIGVGTLATVTNEKNEVLGQGALEQSPNLYCSFVFHVPDLPEAVRYGVTVADRGTLWQTKQELDQEGWKVDLALGR
jgi:hypothetical protein